VIGHFPVLGQKSIKILFLKRHLLFIGSHIELSCLPGTYQANLGGENCTSCDIGKMCPEYNMTAPIDCKRGYYCPGGVAQACPPGTFNNRSGLSMESACSDCIPGKYCPGYGNEAPYGSCKEGYYCQGGASSEVPNATHPRYPLNGPCPAGRYCPTGVASPFLCERGTFRNSTGARNSGECFECAPGFYCETYGLTEPTGMCAEGWYCPSGHLSKVPTPDNFTCFAGHYCPNGTSWPIECETGKSQSTNCFLKFYFTLNYTFL